MLDQDRPAVRIAGGDAQRTPNPSPDRVPADALGTPGPWLSWP